MHVVAVEQSQTTTTMRLFPGLFSARAKEEFAIDPYKGIIYAHGGRAILEARTSNPLSMEGHRPSFVIRNEIQNWRKSNQGHELAEVIDGNLAKSRDGTSRVLSMCNAHVPGLDSVGEKEYEAFQEVLQGRAKSTDILYDSVEAPADTNIHDEESLRAGIEAAKGDSDWLNTERVYSECIDPTSSPSESRRKYLNQLVAAEDAWVSAPDFDACKDEDRRLGPGDGIVMFFDGSKTDDATGLVACRLKDRHVFTLGVWQRPDGAEEWSVPRDVVDAIVCRAFDLYDVRAFFCDPGAGEDESGLRYWDAMVDKWGNEFGKFLNIYAIETGHRRHATMWDMSSAVRYDDFTRACERTLADIVASAEVARTGAGQMSLTHDGNGTLRSHVLNARMHPARAGWSIGKEARGSKRKIDLAVCMIGARMLLRMWEALPDKQKRSRKRSGVAHFD